MVYKILSSLSQYGSLYEFIGHGARTKDDICNYAKDVLGKKSRTTMLNYANKAFNGELPLLIVKDDKVYIDEIGRREFLEKVSIMTGADAYKVFSGPAPAPKGKKAEDDIAKVTTIEAKVYALVVPVNILLVQFKR